MIPAAAPSVRTAPLPRRVYDRLVERIADCPCRHHQDAARYYRDRYHAEKWKTETHRTLDHLAAEAERHATAMRRG